MDGWEFAWVQPVCECKHPHSDHDQRYEADRSLMPCTVEGCECKKYKERVKLLE